MVVLQERPLDAGVHGWGRGWNSHPALTPSRNQQPLAELPRTAAPPPKAQKHGTSCVMHAMPRQAEQRRKEQQDQPAAL